MIDLIMDFLWGLVEVLCWRSSTVKGQEDAKQPDDPRDALRARHEYLQ